MSSIGERGNTRTGRGTEVHDTNDGRRWTPWRHPRERSERDAESADAQRKLLAARLEMQVRAMLNHVYDSGLSVPPGASDVADLLAAPTPAEPRQPTDLAALRRAHEALARAVAPAKPQSLALLYSLNRNRHHLVFPIRLVRVMLGVAGVLLVVFLGSALLVAREASGPGAAAAATGTPTLYGLLYIVSAAGLGAAFYALFTATRYANERTYDEKFEAYYWTRFGLGVVGGTLLAVLLRDWEPLATADLTAPILALIGGFSAEVVHRILRRIVETIDALLRGEKEPEPAPEVTATTERERLVLNLVERERALRDLDKTVEADVIHDQILAVDAGTASVSPNGEVPKPAS